MDCYKSIPFVSLPATCELCHQWLPNHTATCPRKGKPPSQWSLQMGQQFMKEDSLNKQEQEEEQEDNDC